MGVVVLDSSVLIDNLRGVPEAKQRMLAALEDGDRLTASLVTKVEILAGMRADEKRATRDLMATIGWLDVDDDIAELAGQFARRYRASHHTIGVVDYLIAATTKHVDGELWTRNLKHFPMFPKLLPPY